MRLCSIELGMFSSSPWLVMEMAKMPAVLAELVRRTWKMSDAVIVDAVDAQGLAVAWWDLNFEKLL